MNNLSASCHVTQSNAHMYDARPPPPRHESITVGDGCHFHGYINERISVFDVFYIPGLGLNGSTGASYHRECITHAHNRDMPYVFCSSSGSSARVTGLGENY